MKYGRVICDPSNIRAKNLLGKDVIGSNCYMRVKDIAEGVLSGKLVKLSESRWNPSPFTINVGGSEKNVSAIRAVLEEEDEE